jgi:hypothetical protein
MVVQIMSQAPSEPKNIWAVQRWHVTLSTFDPLPPKARMTIVFFDRPVPVAPTTAAVEAPGANRLAPRRAAAPGKEEENLEGVSSGQG